MRSITVSAEMKTHLRHAVWSTRTLLNILAILHRIRLGKQLWKCHSDNEKISNADKKVQKTALSADFTQIWVKCTTQTKVLLDWNWLNSFWSINYTFLKDINFSSMLMVDTHLPCLLIAKQKVIKRKSNAGFFFNNIPLVHTGIIRNEHLKEILITCFVFCTEHSCPWDNDNIPLTVWWLWVKVFADLMMKTTLCLWDDGHNMQDFCQVYLSVIAC